MAIELKMPALSPTMEEGTLARWLVKEGDPIKSGDIIAEIETDKATMEFEAVDEGTVEKLLVPEGTAGVKVGTVIAAIADDAAASAPAAPVSVSAEAPATEQKAAESEAPKGAKAPSGTQQLAAAAPPKADPAVPTGTNMKS